MSLAINALHKAWPPTQTEKGTTGGRSVRWSKRVQDPFGYVECQCTLIIQRDFQLSQRDEAALICILPNHLACQSSMSLLCSTIVIKNKLNRYPRKAKQRSSVKDTWRRLSGQLGLRWPWFKQLYAVSHYWWPNSSTSWSYNCPPQKGKKIRISCLIL